MPSLTELQIQQMAAGQNLQLMASLQLPSLRSLWVSAVQLDDCCFLQTMTQLKKLTLGERNIKGVVALAQLTGLTSLYLSSEPQPGAPALAEQSELGSALASLRNLQFLGISHALPGPVTQALSQLSGLTQLVLSEQGLVHNPGPLVLPACVKLLFFGFIPLQHMASIKAPQLQHLDVSLTVQPSELGILRELCRGVLKACSPLSLVLGHAWSKEDTVALMTVLNKDWQPSAGALQPFGSDRTSYQDSSRQPRQWRLQLFYTHLSCPCLSLLPKGLAELRLM
jgi:hypothetical protein